MLTFCRPFQQAAFRTLPGRAGLAGVLPSCPDLLRLASFFLFWGGGFPFNDLKKNWVPTARVRNSEELEAEAPPTCLGAELAWTQPAPDGSVS